LSNGFQVAFSADESEVGGHVHAVSQNASRVRLLLYEQDEGGAGLLHNLTDAAAWQRLGGRALEILHVNPDTGAEFGNACERACYDCLLSFYNQGQHAFLDRKLAIPFLQKLLYLPMFQISEPSGDLTWTQLKAAAVGDEAEVINALENRQFPLPEAQHLTIRNNDGVPIAEADLLYRNKIAVWIHGSIHAMPHIQARDAEQKPKLKALGYRVVEIWSHRCEEGLNELAQRLDRVDLVV